MTGRSVFCAGTLLGTRQAVLQHARRMCDGVSNLKTWKHGGIDQALHNYTVAKYLKPDQYTVSTTDRGRIVTINPGLKLRIQDGQIVDQAGAPTPVVHQYDRLSPEVLNSLTALRE